MREASAATNKDLDESLYQKYARYRAKLQDRVDHLESGFYQWLEHHGSRFYSVEQFETFKNAWKDQFDLYNVSLIAVHDGETPRIEYKGEEYSIFDIMGDDEDLIYNKNDVILKRILT